MTRRGGRRADRGAVAVEFALVMPVLLLTLFSMVDLGRAFYVKNGTDRAASVGAQALAIRVDTVTAQNLAINAATTSNIIQMAGADTATAITVSSCPPDTTTALHTSVAKMTVSVPFKWLSPLPTFGPVGSTKDISATATWLCVFTQ